MATNDIGGVGDGVPATRFPESFENRLGYLIFYTICFTCLPPSSPPSSMLLLLWFSFAFQPTHARELDFSFLADALIGIHCIRYVARFQCELQLKIKRVKEWGRGRKRKREIECVEMMTSLS